MIRHSFSSSNYKPKRRRSSRREFLKVAATSITGVLQTDCVGPLTNETSPAVIRRAPVILNLAFHVGLDSELGKAYIEFAKLVSARTRGEVKIELFPDSQLGGSFEVFEQIKLGAPVIAGGTDSWLADKMSDFGALTAPYIFPTWEASQRFFASDHYKQMSRETYQKTGWLFVNRNWNIGFRHLINTKRPCIVPADLSGLKIRVSEADIFVATFEAFGASAVPMSVSQIFTAVQQGVVDGAEGALFALRSWKLYEPAKYISLTHHMLIVGGMFAGKYFLNLPADIQEIIIEANREAGEFNNKLMGKLEPEHRKFMEEQGVRFNEVNTPVWMKAAERVYEKFAKAWSPGLVDRIRVLSTIQGFG